MRFKQHFSLYPRKNKNKVVWYYRTYDAEGKRTSGISTGFSSKAKAQAFCENLFSKGLLLSSDHNTKPLKLFIKDFFADNSPWVQNKLLQNKQTIEQYSKSTLSTYRSYFNKHIYPYWQDIQLQNINLQTVKVFREYISDQNLKRKSVNTIITILSIIFAELVDSETIQNNPCKKLKPLTEEEANVGAFTLEDAKIWCNYDKLKNPEYKLIFTLCCLTGMRINEVIGLHKNNIYPDHIKVKQQKQGPGAKGVKDEQPRIVPIIPELYELLMNSINKYSGFIITLSYPAVYQQFRKNCIDLEIEERRIEENLHIHSWRHFYNTYLLSENIPSVKVDAIIGHSDKEKTMQKIYTNWKTEHFADVQEANRKLWNYIFS